jgi:hypothetical protein
MEGQCMGDVSDQRSSVFFDVNEAADERDAAFDPDPTGQSRPPGVMEYFAGRNQRKMAVTNPETDGLSFTIFKFAPGTLLPKHRHNVDYIEFVLAGEVHHGNRVLGPGQGVVYRAAGTAGVRRQVDLRRDGRPRSLPGRPGSPDR